MMTESFPVHYSGGRTIKKILCIPATSAPSERVFSVAGLTIAKDRSNLAPHTAHELIFLQDAFPALRRFEESKLG
jgi:hypothetical protein